MDNNKQFYKDYLIVAFVIFLYGLFFLWEALNESNLDPVEFLRNQPINLIFLLGPLIFCIFIISKGYTLKEFKNFIKKKLLKYLSRFVSFVLTAYLSFYILFPYKFTDFIGLLIFLLIIIFVFIVFILISKFDEEENPELNTKNLKKIGKKLGIALLGILIPLIIISLIYFLFFNNFKLSLFVGLFHSVIFQGGFSTAISKKKRIVNAILFPLLLNPILIFLIFTLLDISSKSLFISFLISGVILSIIPLFLFPIINKKKWFNFFAKEMFWRKKEKKKRKYVRKKKVLSKK